MKDFLTKPLTFVIVVIMTIIGVKVFDMSTAQAAKLSGANQALVDQYVAQSVPPAGNCDVASSSCVAASFTTTGTSTADKFVSNNGSGPALTAPYGAVLLQSATNGQTLQSTASGWAFNTAVYSSVASGNNAISVGTNGARFDFGAGASDYASSDGTTVTFAGPIATATNLTLNAAGSQVIGASGTATLDLNSNNGARLQYSTNNVTCDSNSCWSSQLVGTSASGTGITANYKGALRSWVHKVTVINTALAAAGTSDVTLAVTPVNSRIIRVTADVTQVFTGGALSAMTVTCGKTAGGNEYLLSNSVFTAQNTWGDVAAEVGAGLLTATWADFGTSAAGVPGAITVQCRFTCTGANCNAATQGSVAFYVEGVTY